MDENTVLDWFGDKATTADEGIDHLPDLFKGSTNEPIKMDRNTPRELQAVAKLIQMEPQKQYIYGWVDLTKW